MIPEILNSPEIKSEFNSKQRIFHCSLQCPINMNLVVHISEDGSEIESKHCAKIFRTLKLDKTRYQSVDSIAQLVERRSRNLKMRVRIPLETTNFSLFSAVSD